MSDEIRTTVGMTVTNGDMKRTIPTEQISIDQATARCHGPTTINVGTTEEDLEIGDVGTPGFVIMRNLDATNYVKYGPKSAGAMVEFGRIKPGEMHIFRIGPSGVTLRWIADTAAVNVDITILAN